MSNVKKLDRNTRYKKEINRISRLLRNTGVKDEKIKLMEPVIDNVAWMKVKLDDAKAEIEDEQIVIEYNNGGGQQGVRENPMFKGYESLWKSYMQGMSKIIDCMPDEFEDVKKKEVGNSLTALEMIRARKQA